MDASCANRPLHERAEKSVDIMQRLLRDCNAETTFRDCGLEEKDINKATDISLSLYPEGMNSPRQVTRDEVRSLYKECPT